MEWAELKKRKIADKELVIAVAQSSSTKQVLMTAFQDEEAFNKTQETKKLYFYSTSKQKLWKKGEQSGNVMSLKESFVDCDGDSVLYLVDCKAACHEGYDTCFYRDLDEKVVGKKIFDPRAVY